MDSSENQRPHLQIRRGIRFPSKPICFISALVLFLAISFSVVTKSSHFSHRRSIFRQFSELLNFTPKLRDNDVVEAPYCILWMAPFLSGGGYSSEAWSYISALNAYIKKQQNPIFKLGIEHHGDLENIEFWDGLSVETRTMAIELHQNRCRLNQTIVICHSEPGAWYPPLFKTLPCPQLPYDYYKFVIGRTMFETDRLNPEHVNRCNKMDQVWVPSDFHVDTFQRSGVSPSKVVKIVQPVDFDFFDPLKYLPLNLFSVSKLVLGSDKQSSHKIYTFLSVYKWEYRKGWDVLLKSYLSEFSGEDEVALFILTNAYHSEKDFGIKITEFVAKSKLEKPVKGWASVYLIDSHVPQVDLPRVYLAADAFVLPSRGEGWGRPIVEAMAMALPVIATNWSGPVEYLRDENSYPLSFEGMSEVKEGPFMGHLWAEPCGDELRLLMKRVMMNPNEGVGKGIQARLDMVTRFSPEIIAQDIMKKLEQIVTV